MAIFSRRWSKLQKEFYLLRAQNLNLQVHCRVYRMDSQLGSTDLPRYWITLNGETIFDYPKQFVGKPHPKRVPSTYYPYGTDIPYISNLIREYIDTPKEELLAKQFENDHWGLINIFRAADKRIGVRRLPELKKKTRNKAARLVIAERLQSNYSEED